MVSKTEIENFKKEFPLIKKMVGWSDKEFGDKVGVSRQTINNLENGKYGLTKTLYIAMRYVLDEEINAKPEETKMLKVYLDAFVDHPNNPEYTPEVKAAMRKKAKLLAPAIEKKTLSREEVSSEWIGAIVGIGAIVAGAIAAIIAGSVGAWKK